MGFLTVGFTDPPKNGHYQNLTSLIIVIDGMSVHSDSDSNQSWINIPLNPTNVDLFQAANLEQLVASTPIPSGHYNLVRFDIVSATANFIQGGLRQLHVPSGHMQISVDNGGFTVNKNTPVHLIIDIRTDEPAISRSGTLAPVAVTARSQ